MSDGENYYIKSEFRIAGTPSNFSYELKIPDGLKPDSCVVLSMTIPKTFYVVRRLLNQFKVIADGAPSTITIDPGNYGADNFQPVLLAQLNALGVGTFSMTLNLITGKFAYAYSGAAAISFQFERPSRIGRQMGFDCPSTVSFVTQTIGMSSLISTNVLDFVSTSTLFLHSDMVGDSTGVLQEVYPNNAVPYSGIVYNCVAPTMYCKKMSKPTSGVFNFEDDQEINLNGRDVCITLRLFKKEDVSGVLKRIFPPAQKK